MKYKLNVKAPFVIVDLLRELSYYYEDKVIIYIDYSAGEFIVEVDEILDTKECCAKEE